MMNISKFHIVIPARFNSTRLPEKILLDVDGKPLVQHVYERAIKCNAASVTIATDDERIQKVAHSFGADVCMTSPDHPTGSDRIAEAVKLLGLKEDEIVVNVQGDEPFVPIKAVQIAVSAMSQQPNASVTTLCTPIQSTTQLFNTNVVKVVLDRNGYALYFSRCPIPYDRTEGERPLNKTHYRHMGLYVYRVKTLQAFQASGQAPMELLECLEPLRFLWNGDRIHVTMLNEALPGGVDTAADLEVVRKIFADKRKSLVES